jgi:hypothetical protein
MNQCEDEGDPKWLRGLLCLLWSRGVRAGSQASNLPMAMEVWGAALPEDAALLHRYEAPTQRRHTQPHPPPGITSPPPIEWTTIPTS